MTALEALKAACAAGIEFVAWDPGEYGGNVAQKRLTPEQAARLLELGSDRFWPELYGVPAERWSSAQSYLNADKHQCTGGTVRGKRCGNPVFDCQSEIPHAARFERGVHDRCRLHKGQP